MSKVFGATDSTLTYNITGFQGIDNEASLDTSISISRTAGGFVANYVTTSTSAANTNYSISNESLTSAVYILKVNNNEEKQIAIKKAI